MPGTFIISLDCEGEWGIPPGDSRIDRGRLTTSALIRAYESLLSMLSKHEAPATFAFVMAFTLTLSEIDEWIPRLIMAGASPSSWLRNFSRANADRTFDGWFCSEVLDLVRAAKRHEIACHGFRHLPLGPCGISTEEAVYELRNAAQIAAQKGVRPKTFVYPTNRVGDIRLLAENGYVGFRNANPVLGRHGRLGNFTREFNIWEPSQFPEPSAFGLCERSRRAFLELEAWLAAHGSEGTNTFAMAINPQ